MTIRYLIKQELEDVKNKFPPEQWFDTAPDEERQAYGYYKSPSGYQLQRNLVTRNMQQAKLKNQPMPLRVKGDSSNDDVIEYVPLFDNLINKNKIPEELSGQPLYRGGRISYGTALIKSGKKPGDTIRDPRYQSFTMNPGTAMYHTSDSQYGDRDALALGLMGEEWVKDNPNDPAFQFKRKKKVLLEHIAKGGETGLYGGNQDPELEVIYPRDKKWKIANVRDEDVTFSISYEPKREGKQNVKIYTVERKKKKQTGEKVIKRKVVKRTPVKLKVISKLVKPKVISKSIKPKVASKPVKIKVTSKPVKIKVTSKPIKKTKSKIIRKPVKKCKCK